ncbi:MAG TPA: hypothetical protein VJ698_08580 [Noviherbaspirillum sp.]|uniref:hypothetical protein n=1 Tax=Noviherbaspirillum sp. TaxID=1926288 RepID=UPI002B4831DD|nr:hypothetical protein [Noviherbaspirillum sp.]HJV85523.1 hypothetical protein [Noviherbaspirillum sp.]
MLVAGGCAVGAVAVLFLFPPALEAARSVLPQPITNAFAAQESMSPAEARKQQIAQARTAVHGSYIKDPYGCVYMFQYVAARLYLVSVLDERGQQVCK